MRKKSFRLLALALTVSGVGLFSSCKDYEADLRAELEAAIPGLGQNSQDAVRKLLSDLEDNQAALQDQLNALSAQLNAMHSCDCDVAGAIAAAVQNLVSNDKLAEVLTQKLGNYYTKAEIDALIAAIKTCDCSNLLGREEAAQMIATAIADKVNKDELAKYETAVQAAAKYLTKDEFQQFKDNEFKALKDKVDAIKSCACDIATLQNAISDLEARMTAAENRLNLHADSIATLYSNYADLKNALAEVKEATTKAQNTANEAKTAAENAATAAAAAQTTANTALANANSALEKATKNESDITNIQGDIVTIQGDITTLKNFKNTWEETLNKWNTEVIPGLTAAVENLKPRVEKLETEVSAIKKALADSLYAAYDNALYAAWRANENYDLILRLQGDNVNLKAYVDAQDAALKSELQAAMEAADEELKQTIATNVETLEAADAAILAQLTAAETQIAENLALILSCKSECAANLAAAKENLQGQIDAMSAIITSIQNDKADKIELATLETNLKAADAATNARIDSLNAALDLHLQHIDTNIEGVKQYLLNELNNEIENVYGHIDDVNERISALLSRVDKLETWKNGVTDEINGLKDNIKDLEARMDAADKRMDEIEAEVQKLVNELRDRIDEVENNLAHLITNVEIQQTSNPLFGSVNLPVGFQTNILAVYYGKALNDGQFPCYDDDAAYIWKAQAMDAPEYNIAGAPKNGYYEYTAGDILMDDREGNAGKIYMTINPSNVDFTGTQFTLVNSIDKESSFKLGEVVPSYDRLQFGITKGVANGFYEAPVTLDKSDVYKVNIEAASGIGSAVKDVLKNATKPSQIDVNKVATVVKNQLANLRTDALGLKAWDADHFRGVYSQYAVAGVSIKNPITYASFKDFNYSTLPGYERVMNYIDNEVAYLKDRVHLNFHVKDFGSFTAPSLKEIKVELHDSTTAKFVLDLSKEVTLAERDMNISFKDDVTVSVPINGTASVSTNGGEPVTVHTDKFSVNVYDDTGIKDDDHIIGQVEIPTQTATGTLPGISGSGSFTGTASGDIQIKNQTIHMSAQNFLFEYEVDLTDAINSVINDVNGSISDNINDYFGQLNDYVDRVNDALKEINSINTQIENINGQIQDLFGDVSGKLKDLIDAVNNRVVGLINSANDRLQPVMFATTSKGTKFVSGAKNVPSTISSSVVFYLTNHLAEVVAPAYKKHIAVTNVYNMDGTVASSAKTLAQAVNGSENMNRVLPGQHLKVAASGFKAGYVYEVAYSALDYTGAQVTHKYYVTVK